MVAAVAVAVHSLLLPVHPAPPPQGDPYTTAAWPQVGMAPRNSTEACISWVESRGGYGRSSNPFQFGRWQIGRPLWAAAAPHLETWFPGITGRWGTAGPAEQDAVFQVLVTDDGYGPWTQFDGC